MKILKDNEFDALIVGSGPGGGSVANELCKQGWKTLILEKGRGEPIKGTPKQLIPMALIPGKSLHFTEQMLSLIHGITVGGSSIIYYATAFDPPYEMFDVYGIDLREDVNEAKQELPIAPLSDDLIGPAARRIMDSANQLGYEWNKLPKIVYQDKCRPNCDKCVMGCPYGAKWTSRMYIEEACENGSVLISGADVKHVIQDNHTAVGVSFTHQGRQIQAFARTIILAAGGIGTPMILRRSGIQNVGYDFFFDPLIFAIGVVEGLNGGKEFPITRRGAIRKRLSEIERKRLTIGQDKAREILSKAGARNIYKTWYLATHPGGTVKINDVVDSNLKTEIDNLFVCDCSVIPEAWGLPPTLTLIALGKRLGKHLGNHSDTYD